MSAYPPTAPIVCQPAGRLVGVICAAEEPSCHAQLLGATLRLAREAASRGETVLLLDGTDGALMEAAGILYSRTLDDFIDGTCELRDALFVTSNEHFSAGVINSERLADTLGTMAALSLSYDWVFAVGPAGLSPAQGRLAAGADICLLGYDTRVDGFMRAYWAIDSIRRRNRLWDPVTTVARTHRGCRRDGPDAARRGARSSGRPHTLWRSRHGCGPCQRWCWTRCAAQLSAPGSPAPR